MRRLKRWLSGRWPWRAAPAPEGGPTAAEVVATLHALLVEERRRHALGAEQLASVYALLCAVVLQAGGELALDTAFLDAATAEGLHLDSSRAGGVMRMWLVTGPAGPGGGEG